MEEIITRITKSALKEEKTLLVGYRDLSDDIVKELGNHVSMEKIWMDKKDKDKDADYASQPFAVSWYGNLVGRNEFRDFHNIWLLTTPNLPMNHYPVHYMQYVEKSIGQRKLNIINGRFNNEVFSNLHRGYVRSELYQSLKRIQRNACPSGKFHVVINDKPLLNEILKHMNGSILLDRNIHEMDFIKKKKKEKRKPISKGDLLVEYLTFYLGQGKELTKSYLKEKHAITNWHTQVATNSKFIELKDNGLIKEASNKRSIFIY